MTAGERLIEQGRQLGLQEARAEARREGERSFLLRLVRKRFATAVDAAAEQRILAASSEQFDVWVDRFFSAPTLAELFAD